MIHRADGGAPIVRVTFELPAAVDAHTVTLCGDFNDWSETATPLTRRADGGFAVAVDLEVGRRWHFRYLLDGERWENDWAADDYEPNIYGGMDSVLDLTAVGLTDDEERTGSEA